SDSKRLHRSWSGNAAGDWRVGAGPTPSPHPGYRSAMLRPCLGALLALLLALPPAAAGQHKAFKLTDEGEWAQVRAPSDPDEALLAEAAGLIHEGHPGRARQILGKWI